MLLLQLAHHRLMDQAIACQNLRRVDVQRRAMKIGDTPAASWISNERRTQPRRGERLSRAEGSSARGVSDCSDNGFIATLGDRAGLVIGRC